MLRRRIFLASVFDDDLREPILARCADAIWRPQQIERDGRTVEDVCRELIRESRALAAVLDHRGGRALAFEAVKTPVTALEIELIQALFQKMPIFVLTLARFAENERLWGLIDLAERWRIAQVRRVESGVASRKARCTRRNSRLNPEDCRERVVAVHWRVEPRCCGALPTLRGA